MQRIAFLAIGCLVIAVASARAQAPGVALRWNRCHGEGTGALARSFACDTNAGYEELVGSFVLPFDLDQVTGNEIAVDLTTSFYFYHVYPQFPGGPLPEWWQFRNAGTCRQLSLSVAALDPDAESCPDWSAGQATILVAAYMPEIHGPGTARLLIQSAVSVDAARSLSAGVEYGSFTLRIRHDRTVGGGACGGCGVPLALFFDSVNVTTVSNANNARLSGPVNMTDAHFVLWKPEVVPTLKTSWGAVKALYR